MSRRIMSLKERLKGSSILMLQDSAQYLYIKCHEEICRVVSFNCFQQDFLRFLLTFGKWILDKWILSKSTCFPQHLSLGKQKALYEHCMNLMRKHLLLEMLSWKGQVNSPPHKALQWGSYKAAS